MERICIRVMNAGDYEAVYDLWLRTPGMGLNTTDDSRDGIAAYLRRNPTTCFVAQEAGAIVGVILAGHDGRRGFLYHLAVDVNFRCRGIATALVAHAMDALEAQGIHKAALLVFSRNAQGNAFWEKRGFTPRDELTYRNRNIHPLERIET